MIWGPGPVRAALGPPGPPGPPWRVSTTFLLHLYYEKEDFGPWACLGPSDPPWGTRAALARQYDFLIASLLWKRRFWALGLPGASWASWAALARLLRVHSENCFWSTSQEREIRKTAAGS